MTTIVLWITEVTRMSGDRICIAGVDDAGRAYRPVGRRFDWTRADVHAAHFQVGNRIAFAPTGETSRFDFPHSTENLVVHPRTRLVARGDAVALALRLAPMASGSVAEAFAGAADGDNRWVAPGTRCPSLGAIVVDRRDATVSIKPVKAERRPRVALPGCTGDLAITDLALSELARTDAEAFWRFLGSGRRLYIRLGLAHPWARPDSGEPERCWIQVNAITPIP